MTSHMEISILLVHAERLTINLFIFKVNRLSKWTIQMRFKVLGDSFYQQFTITC